MKVLPVPGRERQERTARPALCRSLRDTLKDGSDGRVLEVPALSFASRITYEQRLRDGRFEGESHDALVAGPQFGWGGELAQRTWRGGETGRPVELYEQMSVGRKNEQDVVARGSRYPFAWVRRDDRPRTNWPITRLRINSDQGDRDDHAGHEVSVEAPARKLVMASDAD